MAQPVLISEEHRSHLLTLIVDKKGIFGDSIAQHIANSSQTILVTAKPLSSNGKTLVIPFHRDIPEIPEGNYSHIFFVWEGKRETLHLLEPLLEKAAADKATFVFVTDHHLYTEKLGAYIHQEYNQAMIIVTGDVFGNDEYQSIVTSFFHSVLKEGSIQVRGTGLHTIYPVLFEDVVKELIHVGFGDKGRKMFLASQAFGMTELSIAHLLQKLDPLIKIDFIPDNGKSLSMPTGEPLFSDSYPLTKKTARKLQKICNNKKGHSVC